MISTHFIDYIVGKKSGGTFDNGAHFDRIVAVVEHPFLPGNKAYQTATGSFLLEKQSVIFIDDKTFYYNGNMYDIDLITSTTALCDLALKYARWTGYEYNQSPGEKMPEVSVEKIPSRGNNPIEAMEYQRRVASPEETLVSGGGKTFWADGVTVTSTIIEAKFVLSEDNEPYCGTAKNKASQKHVDGSLRKQFEKILHIIQYSEWENVVLVTNSALAIEHFKQVLEGLTVEYKLVV
jgi:hypothetical protein